jgi:esterase
VPEVRVNGVTLLYEAHGSGDAIVGLHGAGSSAVFWAEAAPKLATRGRTILYDRRGSFRSERPEPYVTNVHQHADDAAELMDALDAAPAIVIGRSYGGAIAIDLALRYPERVRAVVQLEGDGGLTLSAVATRELKEFEEQVYAAEGRDPTSVGETVCRVIFGDAAWDRLPEDAKRVFIANGPALVAELRGGYPEVTGQQLASIDKPVLLVGAKDSFFDYSELIDLTAAAIPSARVEWVEGSHAIDPAHPVVLAFLDEVLVRA